MLPWIDLITYVISLLILWVAYKAEWKDMHCPNVDIGSKLCGPYGAGMAYAGSRPDKKDDVGKLLDKIEIASHTEEMTVKWRRCYMIAFFITLAIWFFVIYPSSHRFPKFYEYTLMLFVTMMIIYYSFSFYYFHHYSAPYSFIQESVDLIRRKTGKHRNGKLWRL